MSNKLNYMLQVENWFNNNSDGGRVNYPFFKRLQRPSQRLRFNYPHEMVSISFNCYSEELLGIICIILRVRFFFALSEKEYIGLCNGKPKLVLFDNNDLSCLPASCNFLERNTILAQVFLLQLSRRLKCPLGSVITLSDSERLSWEGTVTDLIIKVGWNIQFLIIWLIKKSDGQALLSNCIILA